MLLRNRSEEGNWLFYGEVKGRGLPPQLLPVQIDPRARFEYYVEHIINQFYLGCETPLARLFSTPGFTEASARAALDLQGMLVKPMQRDFKRTVEGEIFDWVAAEAGFDFEKAAVRINWGTPETPELKLEHIIGLADISARSGVHFIRTEEVRKNLAKFGVELWEQVDGAKESVR